MPKTNSAAYLREGFNFQDSYGLLLCSYWLVNPGEYKSLHFELVPDNSSKQFSLDDIVLVNKEDKQLLYQAKYKDDPAYRWTFEDLMEKTLTPAKKIRPSLLQKWEISLKSIPNLSYAALVTNALADDRVTACMREATVDHKLLKKKEPEIYKQLLDQLESKSALEYFFDNFHFEFGRSDIEQDTKKNFRSLGVTKSGRQQLELMIRNEASKPHTIELTLEDIRAACEFDKPRPLVEDILLPDDFQMFDKTVHEKLISDTDSATGGVRVLYGKPGAGKSTYLSYLSKQLESQDRTVIRHHYYLGPDDTDGIQRLDSDRATEALKDQFLNLPEEMLGKASAKNPSQVPLKEYIEEVSKYHIQKGQSFTLIIDGLDHVIRQKTNDELSIFLQTIAYPQDGCRIILGTQESATALIPVSLTAKAPRKDWIEISGFTLPSVRKLIKRNVTGLRLPEDPELLEGLVKAVHGLTQGNPLHLRYTLQQLQNNSPDKVVTQYDCEDLIAYSGDIADYYTALWSRLSDGAKNMLALIAGADFLLKEEWFSEITHLDQSYFAPKSITSDYAAIQHLLLRSKREYLSIYHNSFLEFILQSTEYSTISQPLVKLTLDWLKASNNDALKWSEIRKLEYHIGNKATITDIDHAWLTQAISNPRDHRSITKQLSLALRASFEDGDYAKAFQFHALRIYYENAIDFNSDLAEKLWLESFKAHESELTLNDIESYNFSNLSSTKLVSIMRWAASRGEADIVEAAYDAISDMHPIAANSENLPTVAASLLKCIPHTPFNDVTRVHKYIQQFRNDGWSEELYSIYASELIATDRSWCLEELLAEQLTEPESNEILKTCTWSALRRQDDTDLLKIVDSVKEPNNLMDRLLSILQGKPLGKLPALPMRSELPLTVKEHDFDGRVPRQNFLIDVFVKGAFYGYSSDAAGEKFALGDTDWLGKVIEALFHWGYKYGIELYKKNTHLPSEGLNLLADIEPLKWLGNRDTTYEFWVAFSNSLEPIMDLILRTNNFIDNDFRITPEEYAAITVGKHFGSRKLLDVLSALELATLDEKAHKKIDGDIRVSLDDQLENFPERTEWYLKLASLAHLHSQQAEAESALTLSSRNFLGYGSHKDMFLSNTMDCVEAAIEAGVDPTIVRAWITRLAPIIENVPDFTDGDETHNFPTMLQSVLASHDSEIANAYYLSVVREEEYYTAQRIFGILIEKLELDGPITKAILASATDATSQKELIERAHTSADAQDVLSAMESYFGAVNPNEDKSSYSDPTSDQNDYSKLIPKKFEAASVPGADPWEKERYISGWLDFWVPTQEKEAYQAVKGAYSDSLLKLRGSILDRLYKLAHKYDDRQFAFEVLCAANKENHGWDVYWTSRQSTIDRWDFLKTNYPGRYRDFLVSTLSSDGGKTLVVPIPRIVEFFAYFDDKDEVKKITEQSVIFAEDLMANIILPPSNWLKKTADNTEVLLERFKQPSPITRERTASAIAKIIGESKDDVLLKRLVSWTAGQYLESDILTGVITLEKASREHGLTRHKELLTRLISTIPVRSVVIYDLLSKFNQREKLGLEIAADIPQIIVPPTGYTTGDFFSKYITSFLPPGYIERARAIERATLKPFVRYWSYTALLIMIELGVKESINGVDSFAGGRFQPSLVACSFRISEIYRSSYLRTLHYFYSQGLLPKENYLEYSFVTLPLDFSYWAIKPDRVPTWWPKHGGKPEEIKSLHKSLIKPVIDQVKPTKTLFLNGGVKPAAWDHGSENVGVELHAFGYKLLSSRRSTDRDIAKEVLNTSPMLMQFPGSKHMEAALEDLVTPMSQFDEEEYEEFLIHPLVGRLIPLSVSTWQWFRASHQSLAPIPNLLLPKPPVVSKAKLAMIEHGYRHEIEDTLIGAYQEWTEGFRETLEDKAIPPFGSFYEISDDHLNAYLMRKGLRLGYAYKVYLRTTVNYEPKTEVHYGLLNVSSIIV